MARTGRPARIITKPCEFCGKEVTKTGKESSQRKYWTCDASCAHKLRYRLGHTVPGWQANKFRGLWDTRPCTRCGKPLTRRLTEENQSGNWFCTRECSGLHEQLKPRSKGGDVATCATCGRGFVRSPREVRNGKRHCTTECANIGRRAKLVRVQCGRCGKEELLRPSEAKTYHYCTIECRALGKILRPLDRTHNGKPARVLGDGYISIWEPTHPHANRGWVLEHRWIMEQHLGRVLATEEEVDHKNRIRSDNRLENLQVLSVVEHRVKTGEDRRIVRRETEQKIADLEAEIAALRAQLKQN